MSSDLIFPSSSPPTRNTLKLTFPERYQSYEADDTDNEASPEGKDKDPPPSKSGTLQASFWQQLTSTLVPQYFLLRSGLPPALTI
jgi:hypothetical protein